MQKLYMPISDVKNEHSDLTKRLYRSIGDVVRVLDQEKQKANAVSDLFSQGSEAQRMKLREYCERLIFFDPVGFGRRGEELLWRKGYYEVVTYAKRLHKGPLWKPLELCHLRSHLQAGIGHYHHLLLRLQIDFKMDLRGVVDFPLVVDDDGLKKGKSSSSSSKDKPLDLTASEWASSAVHHCLIYLGDLGRYLADLCPGYNRDLPSRYYHQALFWKPDCGMPHNQLGTLVGNLNYNLDAAYHYMRCLASAQSFEGTESNLIGVVERSLKHYESTLTPTPLHHLVAKFINIVDFCYFQKQPPECFPQVCHEAIDRLNSCEELLKLTTIAVSEETNSPEKLSDEILFKLTLVSIMCTQQLQSKGSEHMGIALAVTLAMMNYLILKAVERLEQVLPPPQPPPLSTLAVNGHSKHRRRRRRRKNSPELLSDLSDDEDVITVSSSDSDMSEEELVFDAHSSDLESEPEAEVKEIIEETKQDPRKVLLGETSALEKNTVLDHIEHLCQEGFLLQTIKLCLDWLMNNTEVLRACAQSAKPMLNRTLTFLNHLVPVPLPPAISDQLVIFNNGIIDSEKIPLIEEVSVRGLVALKPVYQHIDWAQLKTKSLSPRQEAYVRVCKLLRVGRKLASSEDTEITFDEDKRWFQLKDKELDSNEQQQQETKLPTEEKGRLMGQLWLKAEVRELESKVRRPSPLPPYLVLDCDALTYHIALIKQLVHSKKFIMLVPSVVVSSLDEQKRVSRRVRDTIRWLEAQFRQGNRFLRAQRSNEHLSLPLIKYPKKKDKEAWMFFQVAECCHYISQQSGTREKDSLVTLLTGSRTILAPNTNIGYSPLGIANTAGISIEHIETFHSKWKTSSKSHG